MSFAPFNKNQTNPPNTCWFHPRLRACLRVCVCLCVCVCACACVSPPHYEHIFPCEGEGRKAFPSARPDDFLHVSVEVVTLLSPRSSRPPAASSQSHYFCCGPRCGQVAFIQTHDTTQPNNTQTRDASSQLCCLLIHEAY